jgi:hypothetical protein
MRTGLQNFRDLGGLVTNTGLRVRHGVLYRSDAPRLGDPPPPAEAWPPATVIDLRSSSESEGVLAAASEVHHIPLMGEASIVRLADRPVPREMGLAPIYLKTLRRGGPPIARIAQLIGASAGPTLIHCTAGKDRTGLVVAVVLSAVGVRRDAVIADYVRTQANMERVLVRIATAPRLPDGGALLERLAMEQPEILTAPARAIAAVLEALSDAGGAAEWLLGHGLESGELSRLRGRMLSPR